MHPSAECKANIVESDCESKLIIFFYLQLLSLVLLALFLTQLHYVYNIWVATPISMENQNATCMQVPISLYDHHGVKVLL